MLGPHPEHLSLGLILRACERIVVGKGAPSAVPTTDVIAILNGGHAEPVIGRAFARPVGFAHPWLRIYLRPHPEERPLGRVSKDGRTCSGLMVRDAASRLLTMRGESDRFRWGDPLRRVVVVLHNRPL